MHVPPTAAHRTTSCRGVHWRMGVMAGNPDEGNMVGAVMRGTVDGQVVIVGGVGWPEAVFPRGGGIHYPYLTYTLSIAYDKRAE